MHVRVIIRVRSDSHLRQHRSAGRTMHSDGESLPVGPCTQTASLCRSDHALRRRVSAGRTMQSDDESLPAGACSQTASLCRSDHAPDGESLPVGPCSQTASLCRSDRALRRRVFAGRTMHLTASGTYTQIRWHLLIL